MYWGSRSQSESESLGQLPSSFVSRAGFLEQAPIVERNVTNKPAALVGCEMKVNHSISTRTLVFDDRSNLPSSPLCGGVLAP